MAVSAVIEVEDGTLACTVAAVRRRAIAVSVCLRLPFPECTAANLANSLRAIREQIGQLDAVHVVLADRRICHYRAKVPPLEARELSAFVQRESLRQAGLPPGTAMAGHARVVGTGGAGMRRIGVVAAPQALLDPIARGCADADVDLLGVLSLESCIAGILDRSLPERTAVVDYSGGRARFLAFEDGQLAQMRRFVVHGMVSDAGSQALLVGQLAMELPRTLEFLREQGCEPPTCLLVGHHIAAGDDLLTMTEGAISKVVQFEPKASIADGEEVPSLATLGLLQLIQSGGVLPFLRPRFAIQLPWQPWRMVRQAAAAVVAIGATAVGLQEQFDAQSLRRGRDGLLADGARIQQELRSRASPAPNGETLDAEQQRERLLLRQRRPFSLAIARVSQQVREFLALDSLEFLDAGHLRVKGTVAAPDRLTALRTIGEFGEALATVPFLARSGSDEVKDDDARTGVLRFQFDLTWRQP